MTVSMNFTIEADVDRKLVAEKIYGTWNVDTAREYHQAFMEEVATLTGDKWAKMINLTNWKSSYPEMVNIIGNHLKWCRENGMVLSVNIIQNPVTIGQLKRMFKIGGTTQISRIVRTPEDAKKALAEHGF
jgi:hypothetical protein